MSAVAIATGPWAPAGIEQRANAFAAAFLMPTWLLKDALSAAEAPNTRDLRHAGIHEAVT